MARLAVAAALAMMAVGGAAADSAAVAACDAEGEGASLLQVPKAKKEVATPLCANIGCGCGTLCSVHAASMGPWCGSSEQQCNTCFGTWCPNGQTDSDSPTPAPADGDATNGTSVCNNIGCGCGTLCSPQSAYMGPWCSRSESQCTNYCHGKWCPSSGAALAEVPKAEKEVATPLCANIGCGCGTLCSVHAASMGPWCGSSEQQCNTCFGTWCPNGQTDSDTPTPAPAGGDATNGTSVCNNIGCGCGTTCSPQSAYMGPWCSRSESQCTNYCHGKWCPSSGAALAEVPKAEKEVHSA